MVDNKIRYARWNKTEELYYTSRSQAYFVNDIIMNSYVYSKYHSYFETFTWCKPGCICAIGSYSESTQTTAELDFPSWVY